MIPGHREQRAEVGGPPADFLSGIHDELKDRGISRQNAAVCFAFLDTARAQFRSTS
jgi:hypothetical protein